MANRRLHRPLSFTHLLTLPLSQMRLGVRPPGAESVDVAVALAKGGKREEAEHYFKEAMRRDPRNWRAYREAAEFYRHAPIPNVNEALRLYEEAHKSSGFSSGARGCRGLWCRRRTCSRMRLKNTLAETTPSAGMRWETF